MTIERFCATRCRSWEQISKMEHFVFNFVFHIVCNETVVALENEMCFDFLLFYVGNTVFFRPKKTFLYYFCFKILKVKNLRVNTNQQSLTEQIFCHICLMSIKPVCLANLCMEQSVLITYLNCCVQRC